VGKSEAVISMSQHNPLYGVCVIPLIIIVDVYKDKTPSYVALVIIAIFICVCVNAALTEENVERDEREQNEKEESDESKEEQEQAQKSRNREQRCIICLDQPPNHIVWPCRHLVLCYDCTQRIYKEQHNTCPACRLPFQQIANVFSS
jgi:hypothetical protein